MRETVSFEARGARRDAPALARVLAAARGVPHLTSELRDDHTTIRGSWHGEAPSSVVATAVTWLETNLPPARTFELESLSLQIETSPSSPWVVTLDAAMLQRISALGATLLFSYDPIRRDDSTSDEACHCHASPAFVLMERLGNSPIACLACRGDVPVDCLKLSPTLKSRLARWARVHSAIHRLWLDSGDYERWAGDELSKPESATGVESVELVRALQASRVFYRYHVDTVRESATSGAPDIRCPECSGALAPRGRFFTCDACGLAVG